MKITRRDLLCKTAVFTAAATLPPALFHPLKSFAAPQPKATIAAVTGSRADAVKKAVSMIGGMEMFVKKGSRVCLKPNMSFPHEPDRATNTHPEVVAAVARLCIDAGAAEVIIIDYPFNPPEKCLKLSGIADACKGIKNTHAFVIYNENLFQSVPIANGKELKEVQLIKDVLQSDVIISLPTAKSHSTTGVSLGMKGLMGLIWDRGYFHASVDINKAIAELAATVKVNLVVLDASRALLNAGPSGPGLIDFPKTIVAGIDQVAVDAYGVTLAKWYGQGFAPAQVKHIAAAQQLGLGTCNLDEVAVLKAQV
jgi:uncharacterized protein (DUF362 family)